MARTVPDQAESGRYALATSVSHLLHRAEQLASEKFAELSKNELTLRQFAVLAAIYTQPGLSQSTLVRITGIDRSTLADMMSRMQDRGLVTRTTSATDARALAIHLSQSGAAMLRGMDKHAREADAVDLRDISKSKAQTFLETLIKLLECAEVQTKRDAKRQAKRDARREARAIAKPRSKRA